MTYQSSFMVRKTRNNLNHFNTIDIQKPTDAKQLLHLIDMDAFFEYRLEVGNIDEAAIMNYHYGVEHTKDLNEFCDTMSTALYWLSDTYSDCFMVEKVSEAINLCANIDNLDEDMYRIDIIFGAWLSFVLCDNPKMREDFLNELSGLTEEQFIHELSDNSDSLIIVETFTINWIKKMLDPARAAAYGHYMLYLMFKAVGKRSDHDDHAVMSQVIADLYIFTQSASRLYIMEQHNMPLN